MDGASWLEEEDGTGCVGAGESPRLGDIDAAETEAAELDAASELDAAAINPDLDASTKECAFDASRSGSMLACSAAQYATTAGCRQESRREMRRATRQERIIKRGWHRTRCLRRARVRACAYARAREEGRIAV